MYRTIVAAVAAGLLVMGPAPRATGQAPADGILEQHKILAKGEGVWDAEVTLTIPGPDGKTTSSTTKGVETNRMMGRKWLISDFKGDMFGTPFEGHGQNGYDAKKGKYVATWVDTTSKRIDALEGTYDEKTKTLTLNMETEHPIEGTPMKLRLETQYKDDNTRIFTQYVQTQGQKDFVKLMEIKYTKRKK
jgi:hypothetical protein